MGGGGGIIDGCFFFGILGSLFLIECIFIGLMNFVLEEWVVDVFIVWVIEWFLRVFFFLLLVEGGRFVVWWKFLVVIVDSFFFGVGGGLLFFWIFIFL